MLVVKMNRKPLGKGLKDMFRESEQDEKNGLQSTIHISFIVPNPFQPRIDFNYEQIEELAQSIKEQGLLQPIVVRRVSDQKYQIISGERRFRALKLLNDNDVPVIIRDDVDDKQMLELALVENIQREDLNEIETALSYKKLIDDCSYSHQQLSERLGKSRSVITNALRLLKLPEEIQQMLRNQQISNGHARALISIENPVLQLQLAQEVIKKSLNVREIEEKIKKALNRNSDIVKEETAGSNKKETVLIDKYSSVLSEIKRLRGFELKIIAKDGEKGKVEIEFSNVEEFEKIIAILSKEEKNE
jgi:ParB family chromosome partitioning protein